MTLSSTISNTDDISMTKKTSLSWMWNQKCHFAKQNWHLRFWFHPTGWNPATVPWMLQDSSPRHWFQTFDSARPPALCNWYGKANAPHSGDAGFCSLTRFLYQWMCFWQNQDHAQAVAFEGGLRPWVIDPALPSRSPSRLIGTVRWKSLISREVQCTGLGCLPSTRNNAGTFGDTKKLMTTHHETTLLYPDTGHDTLTCEVTG